MLSLLPLLKYSNDISNFRYYGCNLKSVTSRPGIIYKLFTIHNENTFTFPFL